MPLPRVGLVDYISAPRLVRSNNSIEVGQVGQTGWWYRGLRLYDSRAENSEVSEVTCIQPGSSLIV
jgi:hypothetical protein